MIVDMPAPRNITLFHEGILDAGLLNLSKSGYSFLKVHFLTYFNETFGQAIDSTVFLYFVFCYIFRIIVDSFSFFY